MKIYVKRYILKLRKEIIFVVFSFLISCYSYGTDSRLLNEEYFEIARLITNKLRGEELVLRNIIRDHVSLEYGKSYFSISDPVNLEKIIDAVVRDPSYVDFSKSSNKLMIIKDFTQEEAINLVNKDFIGMHVTVKKNQIKSNRVTLFFAIDQLINKGKPWDATQGVLLTGFPDNPNRPYS